ncbi:hemolysin-III related-domain-containing protein [Gorgonomyces haynaldii]|nr:hemolysin-III related-domain-containing protein [Gorgonomyces haynaldii]
MPIKRRKSKKAEPVVEVQKKWWEKGRLKFYTFDELEPYLRDNEYMIRGYRQRYSFKESFISLFHWHNESINVWTHLLGFVFFLYLVGHSLFIPAHENAKLSDVIVLCGMLLSACYTFICSALFHLHICVSKEASQFYGCLDYSGISALICGGCCAWIYYLLYCEPIAQICSLILLCIANLVGIFGPMLSFWRKPEFRVGRTVVYITSGCVGIVPVTYYIMKYGMDAFPDHATNIAIPCTLFMVFQYIFGAVIYANRFPEKRYPGVFDIFGASHQWWHVLVFTATLTLYYAVLELMKWSSLSS